MVADILAAVVLIALIALFAWLGNTGPVKQHAREHDRVPPATHSSIKRGRAQ